MKDRATGIAIAIAGLMLLGSLTFGVGSGSTPNSNSVAVNGGMIN